MLFSSPDYDNIKHDLSICHEYNITITVKRSKISSSTRGLAIFQRLVGTREVFIHGSTSGFSRFWWISLSGHDSGIFRRVVGLWLVVKTDENLRFMLCRVVRWVQPNLCLHLLNNNTKKFLLFGTMNFNSCLFGSSRFPKLSEQLTQFTRQPGVTESNRVSHTIHSSCGAENCRCEVISRTRFPRGPLFREIPHTNPDRVLGTLSQKNLHTD